MTRPPLCAPTLSVSQRSSVPTQQLTEPSNSGGNAFLRRLETVCSAATIACVVVLTVLFLASSLAHAQSNTFLYPGPYRTIDGTGNNVSNPLWGSAGAQLLRPEGAHYSDGISSPAGQNRPNPREISNDVLAQVGDIFNSVRASDFVWQWGQFLDHDMDLTNNDTGIDSFTVSIPKCDVFFDPTCSGTQSMPFFRSHNDPATGTGKDNPRQQINEITGFIDASNVYGSSSTREAVLRANDGTGHLLFTDSSVGHLLPYNTTNFSPNACMNNPDPTTCFIAGDIRSNEQLGLTAMHTLFLREHNRLADVIRSENPTLTDEQIYQNARAIVGAEVQAITYREFLPVLLGAHGIPPYTGYKPDVDASVRNMFSTAAYRFGHSMLSPQILRLDANLQPISQGNLPLRNAFFNPQELVNGGGIEPLLRGLAHQMAQEVDIYAVDDVRNFLFGPPGSGGLDLPCLNLQRGRDHGLPSYNDARVAMGLPRANTFADISSNHEVQNRLKRAYGSVNKVDMWIGGLAEDHVDGGLVGKLFRRVLQDQFTRSRDGDAFWYQNVFSGSLLDYLNSVTLAQVIHNNTNIGSELQSDAFHVPQ